MRILLLAASALFSISAEAELYRWIDPDTGSVKYSTSPPYDARVSVEVVPYKAPPAPPPTPAPAAMAAQPAPGGALEALETKWSELLGQLAGLTPQDFRRAGEGFRQQLEAYGALSAELDRLDPAGAERRRRQAEPMLERLKKGLTAQFAPQKR